MPSLPRIRRSRARGGSPVVSPAPIVHELTASGLTWVNVVSPDVETAQELAERFGWHPLDVEDIVSKRQRPKVDDYEDEGYLFAVLHFPFYDNQVQRLNAAELDVFVGHDYVVTIPNRELPPGHAPLRALRGGRAVPRAALRPRIGPPAVRDPRRPLRLLLPDPRQDRPQARRDRGRDVRRALAGGRPRHLQREAGDHLVPQDHQARALDAPRARAPGRGVPAGGARALLRRHRRLGRADLGPPRQLQGGRRRPRVDERVRARAPPERRPPPPDRHQRDDPAADARHRPLRHERPLPGRGNARGVLGDRRRAAPDRRLAATLGFFRWRRWL